VSLERAAGDKRLRIDRLEGRIAKRKRTGAPTDQFEYELNMAKSDLQAIEDALRHRGENRDRSA
jgi:hypothetical protein